MGGRTIQTENRSWENAVSPRPPYFDHCKRVNGREAGVSSACIGAGWLLSDCILLQRYCPPILQKTERIYRKSFGTKNSGTGQNGYSRIILVSIDSSIFTSVVAGQAMQALVANNNY